MALDCDVPMGAASGCNNDEATVSYVILLAISYECGPYAVQDCSAVDALSPSTGSTPENILGDGAMVPRTDTTISI